MSTSKESAAPGAAEQLRGWFTGRLPDDWFEGAPEIVVDREEITIIGHLAGPARPAGQAEQAGQQAEQAGQQAEQAEPGDQDAESAPAAGTAAEADTAAAAAALGRARRFREETRDARIEMAREVEHTFGRKVSWGVVCEGRKVMFTTLSVPVMTRLRQSERRVLDTLVDAGVARSRSDALAWCVRLVGEHEDAWLGELRDALRRVEQVRAAGPQA
ncbi:MAG: hypothetical protein ACM32E_27455 [Gemmatimonadota bacterium]